GCLTACAEESMTPSAAEAFDQRRLLLLPPITLLVTWILLQPLQAGPRRIAEVVAFLAAGILGIPTVHWMATHGKLRLRHFLIGSVAAAAGLPVLAVSLSLLSVVTSGARGSAPLEALSRFPTALLFVSLGPAILGVVSAVVYWLLVVKQPLRWFRWLMAI